MLPEASQPLFSHTSLSPEQNSPEDSILVDSNTLFNSEFSRVVSFIVPKSATALHLEQRSFYAPISASSRVPCWSKSGVQDLIPIALSRVISTCNGYLHQYRYLEYYDTPDTPVYLNFQHTVEDTEVCQTHSHQNVTEIYFKVPLSSERSWDSSRTYFSIRNTIDTKSAASIYFDSLPVDISVSPEQEPSLATESYDLDSAVGTLDWALLQNSVRYNEAVVSGSKDGWLPSFVLGQSMVYSGPFSTALGLQAAVSWSDIPTTILILKELVWHAVSYGWVILDDSGSLTLADIPSPDLAFPVLFSVFSRGKSEGPKEVSANAFLGISICKALEMLQDHAVYERYSLAGLYYDFRDILRVLLRGLCRFCADAVTPAGDVVSFKAELGSYTYSSPSYSASFLVDIFLSNALRFVYSPEIEWRLARLHAALQDLPLDIDNPVFYRYVGSAREFKDSFEHPIWVRDADLELSQHAYLYFKKLDIYARAVWSVYYLDYKSFVSSSQSYERLREELLQLIPDQVDLSDYLFFNLYRYFTERNPFSLLPIDDFYIEIDVDTYSVSEAVVMPIWTAGLHQGVVERDWLNETASSNASLVYVALLNQVSGFILPDFGFAPGAAHALAKECFALGELRKMMPFGTHWFNPEKLKDVSSNIGSMLYAEASLVSNRSLMQLRLQESRVPTLAVGDYVKLWFQAALRLDPGLHSDAYLQRCLAAYIASSNAKDSNIVDLVASDIFNIPISLDQKDPPAYLVYKEPLADNESLSAFEDSLVTYRGYLKHKEYLACTYKRCRGSWVERSVPGFPVREVPDGYCVVSASTYLNLSPTSYRHMFAVVDGRIFILPITQYFFSLRVRLATTCPPSMHRVLKDVLPVGVKLFIDTEFISAGD